MTPGWAARPRYWICEHMRECSCIWGLGEKMWAALPLPCSELRAHLSSWASVKSRRSRGASLKVPPAGQPFVKGAVSIICPPVNTSLLDLWVRRGTLSTASRVLASWGLKKTRDARGKSRPLRCDSWPG